MRRYVLCIFICKHDVFLLVYHEVHTEKLLPLGFDFFLGEISAPQLGNLHLKGKHDHTVFPSLKMNTFRYGILLQLDEDIILKTSIAMVEGGTKIVLVFMREGEIRFFETILMP